ncbi:hypothetical protein Hypma_000962 [Hypsizygus marmoreus]|uniref:Uncharacterized protein n=1 Tax=Hypsizygus marmoreus TaxID=39966 RepID=A0A369J7C5_HYPMA|nr:hypothetical protein Hypma_000962 [Hypsizygus marmoreus]
MLPINIALVTLLSLALTPAHSRPLGPSDSRRSLVESDHATFRRSLTSTTPGSLMNEEGFRARGNSQSSAKKPSDAEDEGHGDCTNPSGAVKEPVTGAACNGMKGIGFKRQNALGGCLDYKQMKEVLDVGICWQRVPLKSTHGYARPGVTPAGPRPRNSGGPASKKPRKPILKVNTNV